MKATRSMAAHLAKSIRKLSADGRELIDFAFRVLRGQEPGTSLADKRWACEYLTERCAGKAPVIVEYEDASSVLDVPVQDLSVEQLEQLQVAMRAALKLPTAKGNA